MSHFLERLVKQYGAVPAAEPVSLVQPLIAPRYAPQPVADAALSGLDVEVQTVSTSGLEVADMSEGEPVRARSREQTTADHRPRNLETPIGSDVFQNRFSPGKPSQAFTSADNLVTGAMEHPAEPAHRQKIDQLPHPLARQPTTIGNPDQLFQDSQKPPTQNDTAFQFPVIEHTRSSQQRNRMGDVREISTVVQGKNSVNVDTFNENTRAKTKDSLQEKAVSVDPLNQERTAFLNVVPLNPQTVQPALADDSWLERSPRQHQTPAQPPTIQVSIGRIEVRAAQPPRRVVASKPAVPLPQPARSLEAYLDRRR